MLSPPMASTRSGRKCRSPSRRAIRRGNYSPTLKSKTPSTPAKSRSRSPAKFIGAPSLGRGRTIKTTRFQGHAGDETVAAWLLRLLTCPADSPRVIPDAFRNGLHGDVDTPAELIGIGLPVRGQAGPLVRTRNSRIFPLKTWYYFPHQRHHPYSRSPRKRRSQGCG